MRSRSLYLLLVCVAAGSPMQIGPALAQTVNSFDVPARTEWAPQGCRTVPYDDDVLPSRESWRNLHGDSINTDEISRAIGPMLEVDWTAEPSSYHTTGPVLDSAGNLYASPLVPAENIVLMSLDPSDGSRRWAIAGTGAPAGGSTPMVLDDPDNPGQQLIYLALYDRAIAVRADGTSVWDVATGLTLGVDPLENLVMGVNYLPDLDAIVAITIDGFIFALDRETGAQLLASPFQLPGDKSPDLPTAVPPTQLAAAEDEWQQLVDLPDGAFDRFVNVLLGQDVEVANMFSIDPNSGRLWVAATAPDSEDGTGDGVSELGALYGLDIVPSGPNYQVVELCHASFVGGSASTPAVKPDGSRVYVGDNFGKFLTISTTDCSVIWQVDLGQQIVGSIAVSSDNDVLYAASRDFITEVFDQGATGATGWEASLSGLFSDLQPGQVPFNLNLTSIGANGLGFQAGAGLILGGVPLPVIVGVGVLDRETGAVRSFIEAPEETVAVMTSAADGGFYLGNSPVRRAYSIAFGFSSGPLIGGVTKFKVASPKLLARDAACAGEDRALNAASNLAVCPDSIQADGVQLRELAAQTDEAAMASMSSSEIGPATAVAIGQLATAADTALDNFLTGGVGAGVGTAAASFTALCSLLDPCPTAPQLGCRSAEKSILLLKQKGGDKDKLTWKWIKGEATAQTDFGDPTSSASTSLCLYAGVSAELVGDVTVPAGATLWSALSDKGYKYKDKASAESGAKVLVLKGGDQNKSKALVRGKGMALPDPVLPLELPVVAQLRNSESGVCFEATFDAADVIKNEADQFKAKRK